MAEAIGRREQKKLMARNRILEAAVTQFELRFSGGFSSRYYEDSRYGAGNFL